MNRRNGWTRTVAALAAAVAVLLAGGTLTSAAWAPPGAPTGVTPFAGDHAVSLAWQATAGATSYTVQRGTSTGSITTTVATTATPTFNDTSVTSGTTYFYTVIASS